MSCVAVYIAMFCAEVDRKLDVPADEQTGYAVRLTEAMGNADYPQFILLVDRNPNVQAAMIYFLDESGAPRFIGASPATTGKPGKYEYFETPLGVFDHTVANPDFRAEGTPNEFGIRGYGEKGLRVFDFGWVRAPRGWGDGREGVLRLQVHATDPELLEPRLGRSGSKGCIRIPASLNRFIDRYGLLDADYQWAVTDGKPPFALLPDRKPVPSPGRYLVVVDSGRKQRPGWVR